MPGHSAAYRAEAGIAKLLQTRCSVRPSCRSQDNALSLLSCHRNDRLRVKLVPGQHPEIGPSRVTMPSVKPAVLKVTQPPQRWRVAEVAAIEGGGTQVEVVTLQLPWCRGGRRCAADGEPDPRWLGRCWLVRVSQAAGRCQRGQGAFDGDRVEQPCGRPGGQPQVGAQDVDALLPVLVRAVARERPSRTPGDACGGRVGAEQRSGSVVKPPSSALRCRR